MRQVADADRVRRFMKALGGEAPTEARAAVLFGWRATTIDIDVNVELASPADFIPVPPGWEERSRFITQEGKVSFHHFDLYAQALAKVERSHAQDLEDVKEMRRLGLIDPARAVEYFRYPAIDPKSFRRAVEEIFGPGPTHAQ